MMELKVWYMIRPHGSLLVALPICFHAREAKSADLSSKVIMSGGVKPLSSAKQKDLN